jgi:hypothetical protein
MTTAQLYRKHKAGEISREKFLYEVRRDSNLPWITNTTSFDDAVKILKNKSIISELDANIKADPAVDRVNPYFLKAGVQNMLSKEKELTNDSYMKALNKAAKMLQKNPHVFDDLMLKNADEIEKHDAKLQTKEVKKGDLNDVANQMKKVKVKNNPTTNKKAKTLKETALDELASSLKKKESINEDTHWKHTVGSEIHTPDGPGKIKEIIGSTFTVEMQDGTLKDYQINVIEKAIEKQKQQEADAPFMDTPLDPSYRMNKDGQRAINPDGIEFKVGDTAIAVDNNQPIKIQSFKKEQGKIKAIYNAGMFSNSIDIDGLKKQMDQVRPSLQPDLGSAFNKLKGIMEKKKEDREFLSKLKKAVKERLDVIKGKNATTGEDEILATVAGGQGSKAAQALKSKGATSVTVKSIS